MNVCEVFKSIDGEGIRTGAPAIFVRFAGCNLRCEYCDTPYALKVNQADDKLSTVDAVVDEIIKYCTGTIDTIYNLTFTGGEPLLYSDEIINILIKLNERCGFGFSTNIETNGSIDPNPFLESYLAVDSNYRSMHDMFFTFDLKTSSAGEHARSACVYDNGSLRAVVKEQLNFIRVAHHSYRYKDVMKAVVGSIADLDYVRSMYERSKHMTDYTWFISPVFGKIEPAEIVQYVLDHPELNEWRVQVQLHKIIWPPEMRGV